MHASLEIDGPAPSCQRGQRVPSDEREPTPSFAVFDRLEEESGLISDDPRERRDRGREVGHQLAPTGTTV